MYRIVVVVYLLLLSAASAQAQGPLSPPKTPPVPMTSQQQENRAEEAARKTLAPPPAATSDSATVVKLPVANRLSSGNPAIDGYVVEAAGLHGLDPYLILSVMRHESGFNRNAVSPKGASGLMQLMPATATRFGVRNIFDVRENISGGARYLRWLLDRFNGDVRLALAGYNAGEGAVEFYGNRIPPFFETQNYVRAIYSRYVGLRSGSAPSTVAPLEAPNGSEAAKQKIPSYNQIIIFKSSQNLENAKGEN